jgi:hypothetical protein
MKKAFSLIEVIIAILIMDCWSARAFGCVDSRRDAAEEGPTARDSQANGQYNNGEHNCRKGDSSARFYYI